MTIESANYINELNQSYPNGATDYVSEGDDHLKLIKSTLKNSFPNIGGTVDYSDVELNDLRDNLTHSGTTFNAHSNGITGVVAKDSNSAVEPRSYNDTRYLRVGEIQTADIRMANNIALTAQTTTATEIDLITLTNTNVIKIGGSSKVIDLLTPFASIKVNGSSLGDILYPIGCIVENGLFNYNPNTWLGFGTWVEFGKGRVLIGVGQGTDSASETKTFDLNETGGEYNHVLTSGEGPTHSHQHNAYIPTTITGTPALFYGYVQDSASQSDAYTLGVDFAESGPLTSQNSGSGTKHNNIQPYATVYRWMRTA